MKARQAAAMAAVRRRARTGRGRRVTRPRRWPWLALRVLLVLLLAALCCCCGWPEPEPPPEPEPEPMGVAEPEPAEPAPPPPPPAGRVARRDRPDFAPPKPATLPWLSAFQLQVAARSPRLAACFVGVEQPGRLKWSAEIEPRSGAVSDARLEPTLGSAPLSSEQQDCVLAVLADPPSRLEVDDRATPSRVAWVVEF